ncbi:MAG: sigma-70 family RNA polymerase sigma factor [Phycisphaeraceae bacterium]|nr:sigma-70 family RNA polymerase sigma factor [Phycisphaeraceae bacterium]
MVEADTGSTIERGAPSQGSSGIPATRSTIGTGRVVDPAPTAPDEADLVRRLKAGQDEAFEELVRSLTPRLLAVARRATRTEADAEDAVQDAFLSAFKAIGLFDGRSTLSTWLHRIVVNAALMKARKASTRRETSIEALLPTFEGGHHTASPRAWTGVGSGGDVTEGGGVGIERRRALWEAIARLPEEFRDVLLMRDVEQMESKAVAAALGISDALVRQRLHRARQALVKMLEPVMAGDGARDGEDAR